jgi:hypothetical protein
MRSFFVGLVDRATLRAPVLERRARSMFEPSGVGHSRPSALDGHVKTETGDDAGISDSPRPASRHHDSPSAPVFMTANRPDARSIEVTRAREIGRSPQPAAEAGPSEASVRPSFSGGKLGMISDQRRGRGFLPTLEDKVVESLLQRGDAPSAAYGPEKRPKTAMLALLAPSTQAEHRTIMAGQSRPRGRARAATNFAEAPASGNGPAQIDAPVLRSALRVSAPSPLIARTLPVARSWRPNNPEKAMPPVHISIGRLEVSANVMPPTRAPAPARGPSTPKMTLDDYLNRGPGRSR